MSHQGCPSASLLMAQPLVPESNVLTAQIQKDDYTLHAGRYTPIYSKDAFRSTL